MCAWLCTPGVWPVEFWLRCVAVEWLKYGNILCCNSRRSNLYGYTPGHSPILGETLSISFQNFVVLTVLKLWGLGALQVVSEQRFCDLRLRPDSCISYSCLGGFACKYGMWCAWVITVLRASNVLTYVMSEIIYDQNNWIGHENELCPLILASYLVFLIIN